MAIYKSLSVAAGGGIRNDLTKSARQEGATICIGLGGTGKDALKKLKYEVYKRLQPDNPGAAVPVYKNIKYLLIDSDNWGLDDTEELARIDPESEYLDISNPDTPFILRDRDMILRRRELDWMNIDIPILGGMGVCGAGGVRQLGRFLLFHKVEELEKKLTFLIQEAVLGVNGDLNICIFSGISGGTGGGTFIDVCYIVRYVLDKLGWNSALISGFFFLPDVNLSIPAVAQDALISKHIKCNGYAALKELDYLMGLEDAHDRFVQNYGSFTVDTDRPPVDLCYLISAATSEGVVMPDGYDYGLSVAVDYVVSSLLKAEYPNDLAAKAQEIQKTHGAPFVYNIIGAASAEVSMTDIASYLGAKLFDRFDTMFDRAPTEEDLLNFVDGSQMTFEQLIQQLTKGVTYQVPYSENLLRSRDIFPGDKRVVDCANTWMVNARGILEDNFKSMRETLEDYDVPVGSVSAVSRIFAGLYEYAMDGAKGPFFAMKLLGGQNNKNLIHVIDGYIQRNEERLAEEICQEPLYRQELDTEEQELARASFIMKRSRIKNYLNAVNSWYVHLAVIDRHNCMRNMLKDLRDQLLKLDNEFFRVMTTILDTVKNTFKENEYCLLEGRTRESVCTWKIMEVRDIQEQLDEFVEEMDAEEGLKKLVQRLFAQREDWITRNENKIAKLVSDYINEEFMTITNREITDYLKMRFQTTDKDQLVQEIKNRIIQAQLIPNSHPLFRRNLWFDLKQAAEGCVISVPYHASEIVKAARELSGTGYTVRETGMKDRIVMIHRCSGVPLYAYQGLADLERAYEETLPFPGLHLYEQGDVDWREELPSPIPGSFQMGRRSETSGRCRQLRRGW